MATHNKFEQEVNKAKSKSILDVAHNLGMELRHISRDVYEWTEHDSFRIFANTNSFNWFSKDQGGDVIQFVQTVRDVSFKEAVSYLNTGEFKTYENQEIKQEPFEYYLKRFEKPDFKEGYDYLENERGLSRATIDFFGEKGVLAQATKKSGRIYEPVIVFKMLDTSGEVVGASLQGINSYPEVYPGKGRLKQIMGRSDGLNGFHVDIGTPQRLVVAEAPIDLMSYYEIHKDSLQDVRLLAMDGLKEGTISRHIMELRALQQGLTYVVDREKTPKQLENLAKVTNFFKDGRNQDLITLAVDNDEAGQNFIKKLEDKGIPVVAAVPPHGKDWNDYLSKEKKGALQEEMIEHAKFLESVIVEWSEFPINDNTAFSSIEGLQEQLKSEYGSYIEKMQERYAERGEEFFPDQIGYHKTKIALTFRDRDGETYDIIDRIDVGAATGDYNPITQSLGDYLEQHYQLASRGLSLQVSKKEKALGQNQEPNYNAGGSHRNPDSLGDESPGSASKPVANESQPDFPVIAQLQFTTNNEYMSSIKNGYHVIKPGELARLNKFAPGIQATAQWYLNEVANSTIHYLYQDGEVVVGKLSIQFSEENFAHLTGISPKGVEMRQVVHDFAQGKGDYGNIQVSNAIKDKSMVLPLIQDILSSEAFVFDDLSSVEKLNQINLAQAIRTEDEDLILAVRDVDGVGMPASIMRVKEKLSIELEGMEKAILGVYRERDGQIEQLSVNTDYIKDGGLEMLSILQNDQFAPEEERSKEAHAAEVAAYIDSITAGGQGYNLWHDEELENLGAPDRAFIEFHETIEEITYKNNNIDLFVKDSVNDGITGFLSLGGHTLDDEHGILQYMSDWNITGDDQIAFLAELESAVESTWDKVTDAHNLAFEKISQKYKLTKEIEPEVHLNKFEFTNLLDATREFGVTFFKNNKTYQTEHPVAFAKLLELENKDSDFDQMVVAAVKEDLIRFDSNFYKEWLEDKVYDRFKVTGVDVLNGVVTAEQFENFKQVILKELMEGPDKAAPTILEDSMKSGNTQAEKEEQEVKDTRTISQIIADKDTKALSKRMKDGVRDYFDSDTYKTFLTAMSKFHNYSPRNIQLILAQNPDAVHVASFKKWKEDFERNVMKGSKSLRVWAPVQYQVKDPETGELILDDKGKPKTEITFRLVPVFDISQTEGKELPKQVYELEGTYEDYGNLYKTFREVSLTNNVPITFSDDTGDANGYYHVERNEIVIKKGMSEQQTLRTIIHEMAHSELHNKEQLQGQKLTRSNAELQAESVAYVVANHYGLDTSDYTFGYLASWTQDAVGLSDLEAQLQIVQKEANSLIQRMDATLEKYQSKEISKDAFQTKLEKAKAKDTPETRQEEVKETSKKTPASNQDLSL